MYREVENAGYRIGSRGTILSKTGKPMKHQVNTSGYVFVTLRIRGEKRHYLVHRLVASKFVPNPYGFPYVNHKEGNKLNPVHTNLEWVDASKNQLHAIGYTEYMKLPKRDRQDYKREYNRQYMRHKRSNTLDKFDWKYS